MGYVGLANYNRVTIAAIEQHCGWPTPDRDPRGRTKVPQIAGFREQIKTRRFKRFGSGLQAIRACQPAQGRVASCCPIFSTRAATKNTLRYLASGNYDLFCVQTLSPQEIDPDLTGDLKLKDIEDAEEAEVSITAPLIKQYKSNLNAYCLGLKDYVTRRGGTYLFTSTAVPFDTLVLTYLRERGLLG